MSIGFIGAGKVGTAMGLFLKHKHYPLSGYASRLYSEAEAAAELTHSKAFDSMFDLLNSAKFIGITTPDDVIGDIVSALSDGAGSLRGKFIFHMSGALSSDLLIPLEKKGAHIFSLHPLQTIADVQAGVKGLESCYFALENKGADLTEFLKALDRPIIELREGEKARYHLAAVLASNYTVTLIDLAIQQLCASGFSEEEAKNALMPLLRGTLQNVEQFGTVKSLTGPIVRADALTLKRHLETIKGESQVLRVYKALGSETLRLAKESHQKKAEAYAALEHLFREGEQEE